jgi:streptomycin 6-kinase
LLNVRHLAARNNTLRLQPNVRQHLILIDVHNDTLDHRASFYVADGGVFGVPALDERFVVVHPDDWRKLDASKREALADVLVRESAEEGTRALQAMLASRFDAAWFGLGDGHALD